MRRILLENLGMAGPANAANVLDQAGAVLAVVAEPVDPPDGATLRDAIVARVFEEDFGDAVLAGVAFAPHLGGDAIGFT